MEVRFYNQLTNKLEIFKTLEMGRVKIYSCGPTVYDYAHIGNYRSFLFSDLLHRFLKVIGYQVNLVMNITDIDDKTIRSAVVKKMKLSEYAKIYREAFFDDLKNLNILKAQEYPRATEHITQMIEMIEILMSKGYAYEVEGSIYFSIKKFPEYGKLSNLKVEQLITGTKNLTLNDEYQKDSLTDFVLWKAYRKEDGDNFYESPWGLGRPGWHIECSAMSKKYLGEHFDIHTGGIDNRFPHHENEIAQSTCANSSAFVNYWLHVSHLLVEGEKMSKSLSNFYTLRDLLQKGCDPLTLRYMLISTHYRSPYNFTLEGINATKKALDKANRFIASVLEKIDKEKKREINFLPKLKVENQIEDVGEIQKKLQEFDKKWLASLSDDLNTSGALGVFFDCINFFNKNLEICSLNDLEKLLIFLKKVNEVFGVLKFDSIEKNISIPVEVKILKEKRDLAKREKNYALADEFREQLLFWGFEIEDHKEGTRLIPKK